MKRLNLLVGFLVGSFGSSSLLACPGLEKPRSFSLFWTRDLQ